MLAGRMGNWLPSWVIWTFEVAQALENRTIEVLETAMSPHRRTLDRTFEVYGGHDVSPFVEAIQEFAAGGNWVEPTGRAAVPMGVAR